MSHDSFDTDKVCHYVWILMTAGSTRINMQEACCHATSNHAINFCIDQSTNTRETLTGFQNHFRLSASSINQSSLDYNWRARCKNGLSDGFELPFTKPPNYLLSCNVTVAKWIVSCSQHIVLVIWIAFPPKLYQLEWHCLWLEKKSF